MNLIDNTPVQSYEIKGRIILVKREDLSCPAPGPPFSKMRGLMTVLSQLKARGYTTIGYTETSISMAGWGVAYGCQLLGLQAVLFDPQYVETPTLLTYHRRMWKKFNPIIISVKAGMARVNFNISRKILADKYGQQSTMLPLGLPFPASVEATYTEGKKTREKDKQVDSCASVVVNVGSGTICAGVLKAFSDKTVYGIMGRTGSTEQKKKKIFEKAGPLFGGMIKPDFHLVDPGWEYTQASSIRTPFPCHKYYDAKAWQWLVENIEEVQEPILFWNIGRMA